MSYSGTQSFGSEKPAPSSARERIPLAVLVERLRLALGLGLLLLLVVFAVLGERSDPRTPDTADNPPVNQSQLDSEPAFDGRGKWGGYAP